MKPTYEELFEKIEILTKKLEIAHSEIEILKNENQVLREEVKELKEKLNTNSSNSSKSSSQDPHRKRKGKKKPSEKKQGAQNGHKGNSRAKVSPDEITEFIDIHPEKCPHCGEKKFNENPISVEERQVTELPEIQPEITQYNIHTCACACCGKSVKAEIPLEAQSAFGPRLKGFISLLTGELGVTKRKVVSLIGYLNITISVGSVCNIHHLAGTILAKPYELIRKQTLQQSALHADETSWYYKGKRHWLWIVTGSKYACFKINPSRSTHAFQTILGNVPRHSPLTTDRYSSYNSYEGPRQLCWSHLDRDFQKIYERGDVDGVIGARLKECADEMFRYWRLFQRGLLTIVELQVHIGAFIISPMKALFILGANGNGCSSKTRGTCKRILAQFEYLWTFLYHKGVEPTNNLAERDLRPSVIQRKLSYGTQSERGNAFLERMLTVVVTFKKQSKNIFDYLTSCFRAHSRDAPIPSPL